MIRTKKLLNFVGTLAMAVLLIAAPASADSLVAPSGKILLTVTGAITQTNANDAAEFDFEMLQKIGVSTIDTTTAWTQGKKTFEGVSLKALADTVGATGAVAEVVALNDYKVDIPTKDFADYPVILAYQMDGERLKIRDKGPLWVVYPEDEHPELKNKETQAKWVWQVKAIHFK